MPENGCRGPAKLKEAAHLDTDYDQPIMVWLQVGQATLKGGSTISANAQSLYRAALAENIRLHSQPSANRLSYYITYLLVPK